MKHFEHSKVSNLQRVHTDFGVVDFELAEARIDDKQNAVDSQRSLRDVRRHDAFSHSAGGALKNFRLKFLPSDFSKSFMIFLTFGHH